MLKPIPWNSRILGALFCWFLIAGCASKNRALQPAISETAKNLQQIYRSSKRPWPHYNLLNYPIIFISFKDKIVKRFIKGDLQDLNFESWSQKIPRSRIGFDTLQIQSTKYLILHLDNYKELSPMKLTETAIHEGFHYFGQEEWRQHKQEKGRGDIYPLQAVPRYYRWEMRQSLSHFLQTNDKKSLQRFSYWYFKWKTNFKEEYENYTDRIEGTAQYYTNSLVTLLNQSVGNQPQDEFAVFKNNGVTSKSFQEMFSLSYESYVLGTLSGLILDKLGAAGWHKTTRLGPSPLELLARRYKPLRDNVNNGVQTEFLRASVREMEKIDKDGKIDKIISGLAKPQVLKAFIPSQGKQFSSFSIKGVYRSFFNYPGIKNVELIKLSSSHMISGPNMNFKFLPGDFWITAQETPCSKKHGTILLFEKENVDVQNNRLKVKANRLAFNGTLKNHKGVQWFCIDEQMQSP